MREYKPKLYPSPIHLPEKTSGKFQIKHRVIPAGKEVIVVGMRQAYTRGLAPMNETLKEPLVVHELIEEGHGLWMTDLPEELNQIEELVHKVQPQGDVLIGGLGLGILAARVARIKDVMNTVVVEKSADVIKLSTPPMHIYRTVHMDILKYLKTTDDSFDYYLLDTWTGTNEGTWWDEVFPLRRLIRQRWGLSPEIHCWGEDMMWGQIFRSMTNPLARQHWYYSYLPVPMKSDEAAAFLNMVGTPWWEGEYGGKIDRFIYQNSTKRRAREVENPTART